MKRALRLEKITASETIDKGLISKKTPVAHAIQNTRKTINPDKKWGKDLNRQFFQRRRTDNSQAHEKMLNITCY